MKNMFLENILFYSLLLFGISTSTSIAASNFFLGIIAVLFFIELLKKKGLFVAKEGIPLLILFLWRALCSISQSFPFYKFFGKLWAHAPYYFLPNLPIKKIKTIVCATLIAATIIAHMGILQYLFGFKYPLLPHQPYMDFFRGLNFRIYLHSGGYYSIITILCLTLFLFGEKNYKMKFFFASCFLLNFLAVVLATARTYYLALAIIIPLILLKKGGKYFSYGMLFFILCVSGIGLINPQFRQRFFSILNTKSNLSNMERLWMWKTSIRIIKSHCLTGIGYRQWGQEVEKYWEKEKKDYPLVWIITQEKKSGGDEDNILSALKAHPHNSYLTVASETGVIGLGLFLTFWVWNLASVFKRAKIIKNNNFLYALHQGVGFSILMLLFGAFFEHNLNTTRLLLPVTFFMGLTYCQGKQTTR